MLSESRNMQNIILDDDDGMIIYMCLKFVAELRQQVFSAPKEIQRAMFFEEDVTINEMLKRIKNSKLSGFTLSVHETVILGTILQDFQIVLSEFKGINPEKIKNVYQMLFRSYQIEIDRIRKIRN